MKLYILIPLVILITGCCNGEKDRDVFSLGDDFNEISSHSEKKKSVPDMDMLLRVKLPKDPTSSEIINYINIIYTLSRNQRTHLGSDPQVGMLTKVGKNNIDLLLQASKSGVSWVKYGIEAINILADDKDKEFILKNLKSNYSLSKVIFDKGWCEDAEEVLFSLISSTSGYLPREAIKCLAALKKEEHYPILLNYMKAGWNSHTTYGIIKNLPNIEITKDLQLAWENSRGNNYQIGYLTRDTLSTGYIPAFHFLFETIEDNYKVPHTIYNAESLIKQFTYQLGEKSDLKAWYAKNKEHIIFDKKLVKYIVSKG